MLRPVGSQPPSVYWRRRLIVFGSVALLVVLLVLTVRTFTSGNGGNAGAAAASSTPALPHTTPVARKTSPSVSHPSSSQHSTPSRTAPSSSTPPAQCSIKDLAVIAVVGKATYKVGDHPMLELQVTNAGTRPCIQDLADRQVELRVYNGESRVWGSHDCEIQPGTDDRMLAVGRAIRVSITWSGLTSQPSCAGTRQRVGAGTYTLYAVLSGHTGKATQFSIS